MNHHRIATAPNEFSVNIGSEERTPKGTIRGTYQKGLSVCNNIEQSTADESASPKSANRSSNSKQSDQRRMNLPHRNHHLTSSSSMPPSARNREQSGVSSRPGIGSRRRCREMPRVGSRAMSRAGSKAMPRAGSRAA
jgi:hypothetical protein